MSEYYVSKYNASLCRHGVSDVLFWPIFAATELIFKLAICLSGLPSVSTLSCIDLSEDVSGTVNVTVSWTLSGGETADFYLINIATNAPKTPYGGLLNITAASVTQQQLTGFMTGYEYNITVQGVTVDCPGLVGRESQPLIITSQGKCISHTVVKYRPNGKLEVPSC